MPTWPAELTEALLRFGLAPRPDTPARFVRDCLSDLYRHEIRELRKKRGAGVIPKQDYIGHVVALRKKYWPLALTPEQWEKVTSEN